LLQIAALSARTESVAPELRVSISLLSQSRR